MVKLLERQGYIPPLTPNWRRGVEVTYTFKTAVYSSRTGAEQREALWELPEVRVSYNALLLGDEIEQVIRDNRNGHLTPYKLPLEWRRVNLDAAANSGQPDLSVASVPFWAVAGTEVVIRGASAQEAAVIDSVSSGTITLTGDLTYSFAAGATVYQAAQARLRDEVDFSARAYSLLESAVDFEVLPGTLDFTAFSSALPNGETYEDREVLTEEPNWAQRQRFEMVEPREDFSPGTGKQFLLNETGLNQHVTRHAYTCTTPERVERLVDFFIRMKGRRGEFWFPEWHNALTPVAGTTSNNLCSFVGLGWYDNYQDHESYTHLVAVWPGGSAQVNALHNINTWAVDGANSRIRCEQSWEQSLDTARVYWARRSRLASDRLAVTWMTDRVAEMTFAVETIPNRDPSVDRYVYPRHIAFFQHGEGTVHTGIDLTQHFTNAELDSGTAKVGAVARGLFYEPTPGWEPSGGCDLTFRFLDAEGGSLVQSFTYQGSWTALGQHKVEGRIIPGGSRWLEMETRITRNANTGKFTFIHGEVWRAE